MKFDCCYCRYWGGFFNSEFEAKYLKDPSKQNSEVIHLYFTHLVYGLHYPQPVINYHVSWYKIPNPKKLLNSLYVDDLVTSTPDIECAYKFYVEYKKAMEAGGMNLRKRYSNSLELLERILQFTGNGLQLHVH